ncbi:MAG: FAD-dependent oxidoreductase [Polyangiaceae bacterium]|nr:FAD-dependent oxidoreductase [Polyangiaceae bacterium]
MTEARYDVAILGAGPAGYAAAMRAHDLGKRALLVERARVGGTGIHAGALSSKTMWHLSNDFATVRRVDRGYRAGDVELSYRAVLDAVRGAVDERRATLTYQLSRLAAPSARGGTVELVAGAARFVSPHAVEVTAADGAQRLLEADHFLVATGSRPRTPPGLEIDGERVITSDHIEALPDFPESMVVVGAGVIGCEYATIFANFGRSRISILDRQPRILPFEDEDVADVIARNFERLGVRIHREAKLESLRARDGGVEYVISSPGGATETLHVERALVSVGRAPNTEGLGLRDIGVELDRSGGVVVEHTRSTVPHIHAAGDVTMDIALANVAELEARHAVEAMFGLGPQPIRYEALSAIMFLSPEVASVGLNETQAKKAGVHYRAGKVCNALVNRNIAMRQTGGFAKLLASPEGRILGLRVVGPEASSAAQGIAFLIDKGGTISDIDHCVHPHPAITEGVQECARLLLGRSIHKCEVFGEELLRVGDG